jgi:hypothetical protein
MLLQTAEEADFTLNETKREVRQMHDEMMTDVTRLAARQEQRQFMRRQIKNKRKV